MFQHDLQNFLTLFALYFPIGLIGIWRWSVWLFQKIKLRKYHPTSLPSIPSSYSLSVVTPVYNEKPELFRAALLSWRQNGPEEIIAVIDESDTQCISIFREFQRIFRGAKLIITDVPGKRPALAEGSLAATSDIVALVDSDTVWSPSIKNIMLAPFEDRTVGGVATQQAVIAPKTSAERLFAVRLTLRYLHEYPYLMAVGDALTCLSGRTAVYRRSALLPVLDEMLNETFLGKKCLSGEDKRLTSLVMRNGWKVRFQQNAIVHTEGMTGLRDFFKQNLRWSRNSWRTDLRLIFSRWTWRREPLFAYHLIDRSIQPFTLILGPIYLVISLYFGHTIVAGTILVWLLVSRSVKLFPYLKKHPLDISIVPLYTVAQYHLAVLKIYALASLDFQSWITRWHKNRLRSGLIELFPSQLATFFILFGISFLVFHNVESAVKSGNEASGPKIIPFTDDFTPLQIDDQEKNFWQKRSENAHITYLSRPGESPYSILQKFNIPLDKKPELFRTGGLYGFLAPSTKVTIPIAYAQNTLSPARKSAPYSPRAIWYVPSQNTIQVKGRGSVIHLADIVNALPRGQKHLEQVAPKEWILRSKLYLSKDVTLILDGNEVTSLKMQSNPFSYVYIRTQQGDMLINNTNITSWDEQRNAPDTNTGDGRAFIVAYGGGRMDIINSDISYLGFPLSVAKKFQNFGGNYGLSWKLQNRTFNMNALTGNVIGNKIHDNYFGIYTFGASGMIIRDNEIYDNIQYGIDPHDDSSNLLIENNFVHNNGNHGIIGSKRVVYSTIRNNRSIDNRLHGIMLDRDTNYNLVENNLTSGDTNGIAITSSQMNLIRQNTLQDNRFGIRASAASSRNIMSGNTISRNEKGIYIYGNSRRNIVKDNDIANNIQGVYLKESKINAVINSLISGNNIVNLKVDESSRFTNFLQQIQ